MVKKVVLIMLVLIFLITSSMVVSADKIEKDDELIDAEEYDSEALIFAKKNDKLEVKVESDFPVDVYILTSDNYYESISSKDFSDAKVSKKGITDTSFSYKIPDDQSYYLVIYNPNNTTATVSYEYTNLLEERAEEAFTLLGMGIAICIIGIVIIIVVIVLIIYFLTRKKPQPQYPPAYPPYPPQQGQQPPYPPQQGQQPPPQPPQKI